MFFVLELILALLALALALYRPCFLSSSFRAIESQFRKLAQRQIAAVFFVGVLALAVRFLVLPISPIPKPYVHDEFGHLLIADTFAHGRVANPTHPLWVHFETFNEIERPTYQGFAQPGQGLFLAAGQLLGGHPFWGVWISIGLLCASLCWMLQAWVGPTWALYGGLIAVIRLAAFSYWGDSYWGGAVAATAGALVLGALARIWRSPTRIHAVLLAIGLILLANTRPFEGFIFSLPVAAALLFWLLRQERTEFVAATKNVMLPLVVVSALGLFATTYYFFRVTGSPFRMPYQVHEAQYAVAPYFIWRSAHPQPVYHHEVLRSLYIDWELPHYALSKTVAGLIGMWLLRIWWYWLFFLGPILTLPLLLSLLTAPVGITWSRLTREFRFLLILSALFAAALAVEIFSIPHYAAPITCVIYAFLMIAMRSLRGGLWRGKPSGVLITRAVGAICLLLFVLRAAAGPLHLPLPIWWPPTWLGPPIKLPFRYEVQSQLERMPGKHVVLVRYQPSVHDPNKEWVFNSADIDSQKIVWARDMGPTANQELADYFVGRHLWIADADEAPPKLAPYTPNP